MKLGIQVPQILFVSVDVVVRVKHAEFVIAAIQVGVVILLDVIFTRKYPSIHYVTWTVGYDGLSKGPPHLNHPVD